MKTKIIVRPEDFTPTRGDMKIVGTFNMGATSFFEEDVRKIVGMVRVAESPIEDPPGKIRFPYAEVGDYGNPQYRISFFEMDIDKDIIKGSLGKRAAKVKKITLPWNGETIKNVWVHRHISHPKIGFSEDGVNFTWRNPSYFPAWPHEAFGIEDNRLIKVDNIYIITATSPDVDQSVGTSFVITKDFKQFMRLPFPIDSKREKYTPRFLFASEKDAIPLSERVNHPYYKNSFGEPLSCWACLTRDNAYQENSPARINVEFSPDILHWGLAHTLMRAENTRDTIGGGTNLVPGRIKGIDVSWGFYHYVKKGIYRAGLFAIDRKNPWELIAKTNPFLEPNQHEYGKEGYLPNVKYPTGLVLRDDLAYLYSGENDTWVGLDMFKEKDLTDLLEKS